MNNPTDSYETHKLERSGFEESPDALAMRKILQQYKPQFIFVCETKLEAMQIYEECKKLNFDECFTVSRKGKSIGIAMMWNSDINVNILSYSRHYINVKVQRGNGKK